VYKNVLWHLYFATVIKVAVYKNSKDSVHSNILEISTQGKSK
jgi:hypothetical protein